MIDPFDLTLKMTTVMAGNDVNNVAVEHGWYEPGKEKTFTEHIAMQMVELGEAINEYSKGHALTEIYYVHGITCLATHDEGPCSCPAGPKPEGVPIELADAYIRMLDCWTHFGIDVIEAASIKHAYNKKRPYRHGNREI